MFENPLEVMLVWILAGSGFLAGIITILVYVASKKSVLRKILREKALRALHEQGEVEILHNEDRLVEAMISGELFEAINTMDDLMSEGLVISREERAQRSRSVYSFHIYSLTPKGTEEVTRLFGSPPKIKEES